jgi:hypothetical protein
MRQLALSSTNPATAAARAARLNEAIYGAATMPLPAPPPRPAVRIPLLLHQADLPEEERDVLGGPRTVPLPPAPPRPALGLIHRGPHQGPPHLLRSSTDPAMLRRGLPGPTIHEGVPQILQEAQHQIQIPIPAEDSARAPGIPGIPEDRSAHHAAGGGSSEGAEGVPILPPGVEDSAPRLDALTGGSPSITTTSGSGGKGSRCAGLSYWRLCSSLGPRVVAGLGAQGQWTCLPVGGLLERG